MFSATRATACARHIGAFVLQFAHGGLLVAGLMVTVLIGVRVANVGLGGLALPGVFGSSSADELSTAMLEENQANQQGGESAPLDRLSPQMQRVTEYLARRYKVSRAAVEPLIVAAQQAGQSAGLDPLLIIAVVGVESSFNPFAESHFGAQGLMQVVPRFHQDKIDPEVGSHPLLDPAENIRVGAIVLREYIRRHGSLVAGLQQYAGAADDVETGYANKVLAEQQRLLGIMRGPQRLASAR